MWHFFNKFKLYLIVLGCLLKAKFFILHQWFTWNLLFFFLIFLLLLLSNLFLTCKRWSRERYFGPGSLVVNLTTKSVPCFVKCDVNIIMSNQIRVYLNVIWLFKSIKNWLKWFVQVLGLVSYLIRCSITGLLKVRGH